MRFAYQGLLILLIIVPILAWRFWSRGSKAPLVYSDINRIKKIFGVRGTRRPLSHSARQGLFLIRLIVLTLFILALARPQAELVSSEIYTEGVDIILTLDVSGSMEYIDLEDNRSKETRLEITKQAAERFIDGREYDRIGMVVFAGEAYLQCPLTVDYGIVKNFLKDVHVGLVSQKNTAIGNALASSLNRLRYSKAKSKVIILITDGANNAGQIDPLMAAKMAEALGAKIYTIGVGGYGVPYVKQQNPFFGEQLIPLQNAERVDEASLREIAQKTEGKYFRAQDAEEFRNIFSEIDRLEKTEIKSEGNRRFRELFPYFLIPALCFLGIEVLLSNTRFRKLP